MEIELEQPIYPLFSIKTHTNLSQSCLYSYTSLCSLSPSFNTNHQLKMMDNKLYLEINNLYHQQLQLNFQVKFQILYQIEKNVQSPRIGIRLYNEKSQEINIYFQISSAQIWTRILEKRLNQKGFHEMFKPIKKLGKGNFATVYEAQRITDKLRFAVKAFSKQNSYSSKNGKQSLINELTVLRQLNKQPHHNVLKLQAVYQSQNSIYVVLQLLTGQTLFQTIQERKAGFSREEVKILMNGLLNGLKHIHKNRIMHRDIKPQNIMLRGKTLEPVIVDFGLATNVDIPEYLFFRCGTPGYVAPQIIKLTKSEHIQPLCDIFSLGVIFHVLTVKRPLFEGTKYDEVYKNNKQFNFKLEGDHFKGVDRSAVDLMREMLILDPALRKDAGSALVHAYFTGTGEEEESQNSKISSPVLTAVSTVKKEKKKNKFFFF